MTASAPPAAPPAAATLHAALPPAKPRPPRPEWMARSDANAQLLLDLEAKFAPEDASEAGVETVDTEITDRTSGFRAREEAADQAGQTELEQRRAKEADPLVRQDLSILVHSIDLQRRQAKARQRLMVPFWGVPTEIFDGIHGLLDDQVSPARRQKALARLQKYVGIAPAGAKASRPFTELSEADTTHALGKPGLTMPSRAAVEKVIATADASREGVVKLFEKYQLASSPEAKQALDALKIETDQYVHFLKEKVLPHARTTIPLPPAIYELRLEEVGVDLPPGELATMAHREFTAIQAEMAKVAIDVAKARNLPSSDYHDVLRELKKEQIVGEAIMPHYQARLAEVEAIIRRENLVTLPDRPARMRLGSPGRERQLRRRRTWWPCRDWWATTARRGSSSCRCRSRRRPAAMPEDPGTTTSPSPAASWTLIAHEVRPGHELQFDSMVGARVSPLARARYADNSANVEGWGLYSEMIIAPLHAAGGEAGEPHLPSATRRPRLPRSRAAAGQVDLRFGARPARE